MKNLPPFQKTGAANCKQSMTSYVKVLSKHNETKGQGFLFFPRLFYFEEKAKAKADFKAELEFNGTFKSGPNCPLKGQLV